MSADDVLQTAIAEEAPVATISAIEEKSQDDLPTLLAEATAAYSQKHYREAADLYSRATELQTQQNGEMSPENAELLFLYGRCLYHVAIEKSDVLGEKVAGEKPKEKSERKAEKTNETSTEQKITEEGVAAVATGEVNGEDEKSSATKPFFQFTGDENFESDDEDAEANGEEENQEEEDDFMTAFEILDLARLLLQRKLEGLEADASEDTTPPKEVVHLKERLSDTHDLQAEISLEGEQFLAAANDFRSALSIKASLYPPESSYLAELHYKLSLALEFGSVTQPKDANGDVDQNQVSTVDEAMRNEAVEEMEKAISSCKLRIEKESLALKEGREIVGPSGRKEKVTEKTINDVKEMVADMEQRLVELKQPPVSINDPKGTGSLDGSTPLAGILGAMLGETSEQQKARLEEATKGAKDITGLVRKKVSVATPETNGTNGSGSAPAVAGTKRKVDFAEDAMESNGKKARVEDVPDQDS